MSQGTFSVVIPNWNGRRFLSTCLTSLTRQTYSDIETIVVDNASDDGSPTFVRENFPGIQLINLSENRGFTGACNIGIKAASGDIIALLNNDTEVDARWADEIIKAFCLHQDVGMIASKMLLFDQRDHFHTAGDTFGKNGAPATAAHGKKTRVSMIAWNLFSAPVVAQRHIDNRCWTTSACWTMTSFSCWKTLIWPGARNWLDTKRYMCLPQKSIITSRPAVAA